MPRNTSFSGAANASFIPRPWNRSEGLWVTSFRGRKQ